VRLLLVLLAACETAPSDPSTAITPVELASVRGDALLHFWATDCPPCREELPALLEVARRHHVRVIAVSTDRDAALVDRFFEGRVPPEVTREEDRTLERTLGVRTLPDTYVVDDGRAIRRIAGAIDWKERATEAWVEAAF
jgi:thiol-disulfide isomerase/thioredoxin